MSTQTDVFADQDAIAWREWTHGGPIYFVQSVPGDGGVDWGYSESPLEAIDLSPYWQRRFRRDCERVGYQAHFFDRSPAVAK